MSSLQFERRITLYALLGGLPGVIVAMVFLWGGESTPKVAWTLSIVIIGCWLGFTIALTGRIVTALHTITNLLSALREGDYSFRARVEKGDDALDETLREVNLFGDSLREQRLGALEATALLRRVMSEIEVAVFAFDTTDRLRLVNRAGEKLLDSTELHLLGRTAEELGLADALSGESSTSRTLSFPGRTGRWGIRRSSFRQHGLPHTLLVLLDLSRPLREEELQAWQRLVRVLGHELNNSLAPIKSIAGSLQSLVSRRTDADDWQEDMERGLGVIANRAESLTRFMEAYARLARLPQPTLGEVDITKLIESVAVLEQRVPVIVHPGPRRLIQADGDQLQQLLINLVRNAADASLESGGSVEITWRDAGSMLEIDVLDEGPGLANRANLFVPFFTTKPGGTGIGLVLSRQIAEAHGGALTLENRVDRRGCVARLLV
jgi:nitrogen fixation/metabolism regulation signal transduction histidine kinase